MLCLLFSRHWRWVNKIQHLSFRSLWTNEGDIYMIHVTHAEVEAYMGCWGNLGEGVTCSDCVCVCTHVRTHGYWVKSKKSKHHSRGSMGMWGWTCCRWGAMEKVETDTSIGEVMLGEGLSILLILLSIICSPRFHTSLEYPWSQVFLFVDSES